MSVETVKKLYSAGATKVDVVILNPSDPWPSELEVTFPKENAHELLAVIRTLRPDNFESMRDEVIEDPYADDGGWGQDPVTLRWE